MSKSSRAILDNKTPKDLHEHLQDTIQQIEMNLTHFRYGVNPTLDGLIQDFRCVLIPYLFTFDSLLVNLTLRTLVIWTVHWLSR